MEGSEEQEIHSMRLSIDLHSIKKCRFQGSIYAKYHPLKKLCKPPFYHHNPSLEMKSQFRTMPSIPITSKTESKLPNSFKSYNFSSNSEDLKQTFSSTELVIEIWHHDRIKTDHRIGETIVNMQNVLNSQLRMTAKSYAKVYDAYLPVDEYGEN